MPHRLGVGRAFEGLLAGGPVAVKGFGQLAGALAVLRQQRRLDRVGAFEIIGEAAVQAAAALVEQRVIGGVADQRVLEGVVSLRRRAAAEHQLGGSQTVEGAVERVGRPVGDRRQGRMVEDRDR